MVLAQVCGMPIDCEFSLYDEVTPIENNTLTAQPVPLDMESVFANRSEIQSLSLAEKIYHNKQKVAFSGMLPTVALTGNYMISNPNLFNGFEKEFKGVFNVGVLVRIPLLHWGENVYKYRAAKSESLIARLEIEDAKEKIELQVNQATFKVDDSA